MGRVLVLCLLVLTSGLARADEPVATWIYWSPSWEEETKVGARSNGSAVISPRAAARLTREGGDRGMEDPSNRPVPAGFLQYLQGLRIAPRHASRFLRAVSADLMPSEIVNLTADPNVARLVPVRVLRGGRAPLEPFAGPGSSPGPRAEVLDPRALRPVSYGPSWAQLEQIGVQRLHERGYAGQGVWIAMLDAGTRTTHAAFGGLDLGGQRDFVAHDGIVQEELGDAAGTDRHGTYTASALAGFLPDTLIGPAYQARLFLARTEEIATETRVEEDNFVAAVEWADSLGVDVISTSLGYREFDDGSAYQPADLDGRTAVTTRAAAWAARRGIIVVSSAGNYGSRPSTISTPADAESLLAVGAVTSDGVPASFSSRGPTADGRVKPDLSARGVGTVCAARSGGITYVDGTSLAAPLIAGLAALLRQAHPEWTAMQVVDHMRRAGSQADQPDNVLGYGIPDGFAAADLPGGSLIVAAASWRADGALADSVARPGASGSILLTLRNAGRDRSEPSWITLCAANGAAVGIDSVHVRSLEPGEPIDLTPGLFYTVDAEIRPGARLPIFARVRGEDGVLGYRRLPLWAGEPLAPPPDHLALEPLARNPLRAGTPLSIRFRVPGSGLVTVRIYDVQGRLIATPFSDRVVQASDTALPAWLPSDDLASGAYWLRFETPWGRREQRFAVVR